MSTGGSFRKLRGTRIQISEIARRAQGETPRAFLRSRLTVPVRKSARFGWVTFEAAPKVDEFEPLTETREFVHGITLPRRSGKPSGASIHISEGDWSIDQQLHEERDRGL